MVMPTAMAVMAMEKITKMRKTKARPLKFELRSFCNLQQLRSALPFFSVAALASKETISAAFQDFFNFAQRIFVRHVP